MFPIHNRIVVYYEWETFFLPLIFFYSLLRVVLTLSAVMLTLYVIVSFSPCFTQCIFTETLPVATLEALSTKRSALLSHGEYMGRAKLAETVLRNLRCVQLGSFMDTCQRDLVQGAYL
jgi:hypothetical protein